MVIVHALGSNNNGKLGIGGYDDTSKPRRCQGWLANLCPEGTEAEFGQPSRSLDPTTGTPPAPENSPKEIRMVSAIGGAGHSLVRWNTGRVWISGYHVMKQKRDGTYKQDEWHGGPEEVQSSDEDEDEDEEEEEDEDEDEAVDVDMNEEEGEVHEDDNEELHEDEGVVKDKDETDGRDWYAAPKWDELWDVEFSASSIDYNQNENWFYDKFKLCSATLEASVFVSEQDSRDCVLVMGNGEKGELGLGETCTTTDGRFLYMPITLPPGSPRIIGMSSGVHHTAIVLENGQVWGWGYGRNGQLGPSVTGTAWKPTLLQGIGFSATRVACGNKFTAIAGREDQLAILGGTRYDVKASLPPHEIPGFINIQAGWRAVYVLFDDGTLIGWGNNQFGQLPPENLPPIKQFAAGSEHVVALTQEEAPRVLAWGWGKHGNCGEELDENGVTVKKGTWNVIWEENEDTGGLRAMGVGAGWATTFIDTDKMTDRADEINVQMALDRLLNEQNRSGERSQGGGGSECGEPTGAGSPHVSEPGGPSTPREQSQHHDSDLTSVSDENYFFPH